MREKVTFFTTNSFLTVLLAFLTTQQLYATSPSFQGLGYMPRSWLWSEATGISADGTTVVGSGIFYHPLGGTYNQGFRWTVAGGLESFDSDEATLDEIPHDVSADGSVVVGSPAYRWTQAEGGTLLGLIPGGSGTHGSTARAVSDDGAVVAGESEGTFQWREAFRWTQGTGMVGLGYLGLPSQGSSFALGISGDGSVIVGTSPYSGDSEFRWTEENGMVGLGAGSIQSPDASYDGSVIVGYGSFGASSGSNEAFRWTEKSGPVGLGDLPGGGFRSQAYAVSADGSIVVGSSETA